MDFAKSLPENDRANMDSPRLTVFDDQCVNVYA
jgi:hypothetical protein